MFWTFLHEKVFEETFGAEVTVEVAVGDGLTICFLVLVCPPLSDVTPVFSSVVNPLLFIERDVVPVGAEAPSSGVEIMSHGW